MASLRAMKASAPAFAERGWGRVVQRLLDRAKRPSAAMPEYSVAKAAELSLSRLFADRYAGDGVLVNTVCPGAVESEMWMEPAACSTRAPRRLGLVGRRRRRRGDHLSGAHRR